MTDRSRRLSEADAYFLRMSEAIGMTAAGVDVTVLEGPPDPDLEHHYRELHARLLPTTRRRIVEDRFSTALPRWVDAHGADPNDHWMVAPPPGDGTLRGVLDWAATWAASPMPADRPPWRAARFDGVDVDGQSRTVTVRQMHHAILDGGGALRLARQYFRADPAQRHTPLPDLPEVEHIGAVARWREGWADEGEKLAAAMRANGQRLRWAAAEPRAAASRLRALAGAAHRLQAPIGPVPMSPLLRGRGARLRFDRLELDLAGLKAGANAAGGTVNDGLMSVTALALRRWHLARGVQIPAVRTAMAVDRRPKEDESASGNHALAVVVELPTDEDDIRLLIKRCSELSRQARDDDDALWLLDRLRAAGNRMPRRLAVALSRRALSGLDVSISNVAGSTEEQWEAGVRKGPGCGFIVGTLSPIAMLVHSQSGRCVAGLTTCPDVLPDVEPLLLELRTAFADLYDLA